MVVSPVFRWNSEGLGWGGDLVTARLAGVVAGRSLSPGVPPPRPRRQCPLPEAGLAALEPARRHLVFVAAAAQRGGAGPAPGEEGTPALLEWGARASEHSMRTSGSSMGRVWGGTGLRWGSGQQGGEREE